MTEQAWGAFFNDAWNAAVEKSDKNGDKGGDTMTTTTDRSKGKQLTIRLDGSTVEKLDVVGDALAVVVGRSNVTDAMIVRYIFENLDPKQLPIYKIANGGQFDDDHTRS